MRLILRWLRYLLSIVKQVSFLTFSHFHICASDAPLLLWSYAMHQKHWGVLSPRPHCFPPALLAHPGMITDAPPLFSITALSMDRAAFTLIQWAVVFCTLHRMRRPSSKRKKVNVFCLRSFVFIDLSFCCLHVCVVFWDGLLFLKQIAIDHHRFKQKSLIREYPAGSAASEKETGDGVEQWLLEELGS